MAPASIGLRDFGMKDHELFSQRQPQGASSCLMKQLQAKRIKSLKTPPVACFGYSYCTYNPSYCLLWKTGFLDNYISAFPGGILFNGLPSFLKHFSTGSVESIALRNQRTTAGLTLAKHKEE